MKRKIFVTAVILSAMSFWLSAQDVIITKDSRRIRAKVTEVNVNDVKYKSFTNLNGPTYTIPKNDIVSIEYQNGEIDTFVRASTPSRANTSRTSPTFSQPPLTYRNGVRLDGVRLKPNDVRMVMEEDPDALYTYNKGRKLGSIAFGLSYAGGAMIGVNLGLLIADEDPIPVLYALGGASITAGFILAFIADGKIKQSVSIYNSGQRRYSAVPYQINFGLTQTGVGFTMNF